MSFIKKSLLFSLITIASLFVLVSCNFMGNNQTKISLTPVQEEVTVELGEKIELQFTAIGDETNTEEVILANLEYTSSDSSIVEVKENELIAVGVGSADITVTWKEDAKVKASVKVNVTAPQLGEVVYSEVPSKVFVGNSFEITFNATSDVTVSYTSSDSEVLEVSGNMITAKKEGSAKILAVATNGYEEAQQEWEIVVEVGEYKITYVLNGGINSSSNPTTYSVDKLPLKLLKATKLNKNFLGWSLEEGSTEYITEIPAGTTGDITLYANYGDIVRKITYVLNGGAISEDAPKSFIQGVGCELVNPKKDGYIFLGWSLSANSTSYVTKIDSSRKSNATLYANWEKIVVHSNIVYELDGGENPVDAPSKYEEGTSLELPIPTKEGYKFVGWQMEGTTGYVQSIPATQTGEVKLVAKWELKPTLDIEGGLYVGEGLDYATLDDAVANAPEGSKIVLSAGEYVLSVSISKNLEIIGPNYNLKPSDFGKEEAVISIKLVEHTGVNLAAANIVFNGVSFKGVGGGGGIQGVYFQDGGNVEKVLFKSCTVSEMNTFLKFRNAKSSMELTIQDSYISRIGQFIVWTQDAAFSKLILLGNHIDGASCGEVTNAAAALFRLRSGSLEAYDNLFTGDSANVPGYFELSAAGSSVVKYNAFKNVSAYVYTTTTNNVVFDENLYLDKDGNALDSAPKSLAASGLTADKVVASSEEDRASRYINGLISQNPDRYFKVEYELNEGEFVSGAPTAYDKEVGLANLPLVEREGYLFLGWYLNGEKVNSVAAGTTGNLVLVAKWREPALVVDGTNEEGHYESLAAALAAVKEGETIKLVAGEYADEVTINVANIRIIGPNAGIDAKSNARVAEAIVKGVFNVTSKAQNLTIDGLSFTGGAKVIYAESANYEGFVFKNNKVYDTTESAKAWDESRYSLPAFLQFTLASGGKLINTYILNNTFVNVSEINLLANRAVNLSVDGNIFKDFDLDAIRIEGGNCYGVFGFTNNVFEQTNKESGNNGIFLYSIAGANDEQKTFVVIKNNSFVKLGKNNGSVFTGAISAYRFQEHYTEIEIEHNIFDHCYDYLYLRNNGGNNTNWFCNVENNQFLGLPTNQYYGSYRGSDSSSTNPHLAVFSKNYYEDNEGKVITDLSGYADYFKHMSSYGVGLENKPGAIDVLPVEFWTISYELNGGSTKESFTYEYTSINDEPIYLPVLTLNNHQFNGWLLNGELVSEIPASARGNLHLVANFSVLEGEVYNIEYVTNKENVIWPSRGAEDHAEIIDALFADLYEWAKMNGESKAYDAYVADIKSKLAAYSDIKIRNPKLGNYAAEDDSTEYFLNIPKYYQKWNEFFAVFNEAMLKVNAEQVFYTDTYAAMVRLNQFVTWSSTGEKYFASYLTRLCAATKVPQEIATTYRGGQTLVLPKLALANGLEFLGWYDNPDFVGEAITSISVTDSGDKVYYAKWADEIKPETIEINKINQILLFNSHQLVWSLTPSNVTDPSVEFFSSNEKVAKVNSKGLITTYANGVTTITVKVYGNRELDVVFDLEVYTDDYIKGEYETESYVLIDQSIKLLAEIAFKNGTTGKVAWKSLTPEYATIDENGVVTGVNPGLAKIIAYDPNNEELQLEFIVTVLEELPEGILGLALRSNESNVFTRYDLNIGNTYNKDILGSVSKLFANSPLVKNNKYYEQANKSEATYGTMKSIEFITVHYTGNMAAGADAAANASYFATNGSTSIHYTTGNDGVFYCMDESKSAFHAGDSGALAQVGEFTWIKSGVKVGANDPLYPVFTISNDFYYEINGQKTTIKMPSPWNYNNRNTDHTLNADGTISSKPGYGQTAFANRTPESFINDQSLPFKVVDGEYYMGTTWWAYTQVYEGRICSTGGNRNSIGIESCVNEGSDLWWTWQKTAQLVADLMVRYNLDITRVRGHHFYTAKDCPQPMLENDLEIWWEFLALVEAEYELLTEYEGYEVSITSNNPDIVDNNGRVVKQPTQTTCVSYTITFTKDGESKSITLASMVKGLYVDR